MKATHVVSTSQCFAVWQVQLATFPSCAGNAGNTVTDVAANASHTIGGRCQPTVPRQVHDADQGKTQYCHKIEKTTMGTRDELCLAGGVHFFHSLN